jgi:outer membrane protein OmpA-like peptidoglycan-associated protein
VSAPAAPAAPAPAASAAGLGPATVFFAVGSSTVESEGGKVLADLAATLKARPDTTVSISGFHSAAGDLAKNQELAKNRAIAVRDALVAAGIAQDRLVLDKPLQTEANISGEDPRSRRVDVAVR